MNDETRWSPHHQPAEARKRAPELLWSLWGAGVTWSCELRFHGESYGWEATILRNGELFAAQGAFVSREAAVRWAEEQRKDAERGFLE
jgi:hypothetical protein